VSAIDRLRNLLRQNQLVASQLGYRESADSIVNTLEDLALELRTARLRIRALERRLDGRGLDPGPTARGHDLRQIASVLEGLAKGETPHVNTVYLRHLAAAIRGITE
jgi:hypothetical protein